MRHWTWADWLETNLLRSDWIFAQLDWAPKKGPATTRDWRTAVHTPSLPGLSMQPQNHYWHQLCTESSELSWISHWPRQNPQQFRYILFKYWCSTLYVMHDFNFNQYQLLINIEQIYAYIYIWLRYAYLQISLHIILRGQHNHVGQGSAIHGTVLFYEFRECPDQADAEPLSTVPADNLERWSYEVDISRNTGEIWGLGI